MTTLSRATLLAGVLVFLGAVRPPAGLQAQTATDAAAPVITAPDLAHHIAALAPDSLRNAAAPGAGLERAAQYVAAQFEALGLLRGQQAGPRWRLQDTSWLQRYPVPGQLRASLAGSSVAFTTTLRRGKVKVLSERGGFVERRAVASFNATARFEGTLMPRWDLEDSRPVVLLAGRHTPASVERADVRGKIVLYVPPAGGDTVDEQAVRRALAAQCYGVVVLPATDSVRFAAAVQAAQVAGVPIADDYMFQAALAPWVVEVWPGFLRGLLAANELDLEELRGRAAPLVQALPFVNVQYAAVPAEPTDSVRAGEVTLPNVVGTLEGTDSVLKREYIVLVAHLGRGSDAARSGQPARMVPDMAGAEDKTSGVAALLALAKAFSSPEARPKRSLVFLATTGPRPGFWGSNYFLRRQYNGCVMALVLDRLAGPAGDSVVMEGAQELILTPSPAWVVAAHPELGVTVVDTGSAFLPTAEHYAFSRLAFTRTGIPSLYVHNVHAGVAAAAAAPRGGTAPVLDAAQIARAAQLVHYLLREVADAPTRPAWNEVGRARALAEQP